VSRSHWILVASLVTRGTYEPQREDTSGGRRAARVQALQRALRSEFHIEIAGGSEAGLQVLTRDGPFAVVVSDLRMPVMDGVQFLSRVKAVSPDSIRVMLTGQADLNAAIAAVNEGNIFRFLTKPCPPATMSKVLEASLEQYRLVTAERELLQNT